MTIHKKIINPVKTIDGQAFCEINYNYDKLSIHGVIAPLKNGNCRGSCGQMYDSLLADIVSYNEGWNKELVAQFVEVWKKWHLNDMQAGTPKQMQAIEDWENAGNKYDYDKVVDFLKTAGIYEDNGYKYGSAWLFKEVPQTVVQFLVELPDSKRVPAWV